MHFYLHILVITCTAHAHYACAATWAMTRTDIQTPEEWLRWFRRFDQFQVMSGLAADSEEKQVSTLLHVGRHERARILMLFICMRLYKCTL